MNFAGEDGPNIGIILERMKEAKKHKLVLPKEPNFVQRLNQVGWLKQTYEKDIQALKWQRRDGSTFIVSANGKEREVEWVSYHGSENFIKLSDGTVLEPEEARNLIIK